MTHHIIEPTIGITVTTTVESHYEVPRSRLDLLQISAASGQIAEGAIGATLNGISPVKEVTLESAVSLNPDHKSWESVVHSGTPLTPDQARGLLRDDESDGSITFTIAVPFQNFLQAVSSPDPDNWDEHDYLHSRVLAFGLPYASSWRALSLDKGNLTVQYTTNVGEALVASV